MGIFKKFVGAAQQDGQPLTPASDKLITPANAMTATRPMLAIKAAQMLINGRSGVGPVVAIMAATDMEGSVARFIDKQWPDSGLGTSTKGTKADKYADAVALLTVAGASLLAPRISKSGKLAVGTILTQEGYKTVWAGIRAAQFANETGQLLEIPVTMEGKEAMAEKFVALESAVLTGDTDNRLLRNVLGGTALAFAGIGAYRGEKVRSQYETVYQDLLSEHLPLSIAQSVIPEA
ncbi:hypothetical protein KC968_03270 [Candidatus Saccharibacteria bacterium]|nr:hypothetical protein [Candidatus Saccharibacteria bacterium]